MKIIDIGIVQDNNDPKCLGRIRYKLSVSPSGPTERALENYTPWGDDDLFVAQPFLPTNINFIPEIGQSVKIIVYNTDKGTQNQEYISGPFSTMHDFNGQTASDQVQNTSYGAAAKHVPDIKTQDGSYRDPNAEGAHAKHKHYGVYGKYGSDLIFTDDGLMLRGGKLISKDAAKAQRRIKMLAVPEMSKKSSKLYLKKFPKKMTLQVTNETVTKVENKLLNHIVEYSVDNLNNPTTLNIYVYKVGKVYGSKYFTNYFTEHTELDYSLIKLINLDNTTTTPTFTLPIIPTNSGSTQNLVENAYKEIRDVLFSIHEYGLKEINPYYSRDNIHPFYFRPTKEFRERTDNIENKLKILNNVKLSTVGPVCGLVWAFPNVNPPIKTTTNKIITPKIDPNSPEQSFGALITDKFYLLSTDANETEDKSIHFEELDKYEYTQQDYIQKIEPNTFSMVRGENLINLLRAIVKVLVTHKHNINEMYARTDYPDHNKLVKLVEKMENDLLNNSLRLN